jgi:phage terminase large subunit
MKRLMLEDEYLQEMECSFEASTRGAFYAKEAAAARVGNYPADPSQPLHFVFDIGRTDDTAFIAFQEHPQGVNCVHAESTNMQGPQYSLNRIAHVCHLHQSSRGVVWLPPDAKAQTWATQRSGVEQFIDAGIRPKIIPGLGELDGINAARWVFQFVTFNEPHTEELVTALKSFHRQWDELRKAYTNEPVKDWTNHYADAFRYLALVAHFPYNRPLVIPQAKAETNPALLSQVVSPTYPVTLSQLWEDRDATSRNQSIH